MVLLAATTGLRANGILGLKWQDVDFESLEISINCSVVHQVVGEFKKEASQRPLPLVDPGLAHSLLEWRRTPPFMATTRASLVRLQASTLLPR